MFEWAAFEGHGLLKLHRGWYMDPEGWEKTCMEIEQAGYRVLPVHDFWVDMGTFTYRRLVPLGD